MKLGIYLAVALFIAVACGKNPACSVMSLPAVPQVFGTLEEIRCPSGQLLDRVTPHILPGGIVTSYTAHCVRSEVVCK